MNTCRIRRGAPVQLRAWTCIGAALFLCSCPDQQRGNDRWSQYRAGASNPGFVHVDTTDPVSEKWVAHVGGAGGVGFAAPVIAPDNSVVVGNLDGNVLVRRDYGLEKWTRYLSKDFKRCLIASSAAVDEFGRIYVIVTAMGTETNVFKMKESTLFCLAPRTGATLWMHEFEPNGRTTTSPRLWGSGDDLVIFVYWRGEDFQRALIALDKDGNEIARAAMPCIYPNNISSDDFLGDRWERGLYWGFLIPFGFLFGWEVSNPASEAENIEERQWWIWPDATPAIVPANQFAPGDKPWIVMPDSLCALNAFTWDAANRTLDLQWSIDDPADARYSSACVVPQLGVVVGTSTGKVNCYWLASGGLKWSYHTGEKMIGTPLFSRDGMGAHIYASSDKHLYELNTNGTLSRKISLLAGTSASPAQSRERLYITSRAGLFSYPYKGPGGGGVTISGLPYRFNSYESGFSSPIVGPDGVVYDVAADGFLRAYEMFEPPSE